MQQIRTKEINKISKRKGSYMKNLALLALTAMVAFSMSTASANTRTATRVLTETKVGQQIIRDFAVSKNISLATQADISKAVQAFITAKGGEAVAGAAIVAKVDALSASTNVNEEIKAYARVSTKSMMQKELDGAAAARVDAGFEDVVNTTAREGAVSQADADKAIANAAVLARNVGHQVTGEQNVCSTEGCLSKMGKEARATFVNLFAKIDAATIRTEAALVSAMSKVLAAATSVTESQAAKNLCYLASNCKILTLNSCPVAAK